MKRNCALLVVCFCHFLVLGPAPAIAQSEEGDKKAGSAATAAIGSRTKGLEGEEELRLRLDAFFAALIDGKVRTAFEQLLKDSEIGKQSGNIESLIEQTNDVFTRLGDINGHELMKSRRKGTRLVAYTYISHSDILPIQWEIFCYRSSKGWQILDITVNNDLGRIFAD